MGTKQNTSSDSGLVLNPKQNCSTELVQEVWDAVGWPPPPVLETPKSWSTSSWLSSLHANKGCCWLSSVCPNLAKIGLNVSELSPPPRCPRKVLLRKCQEQVLEYVEWTLCELEVSNLPQTSPECPQVTCWLDLGSWSYSPLNKMPPGKCFRGRHHMDSGVLNRPCMS